MTAPVIAATEAHAALFNACVRSGDWTPFIATFTEDARMTLTNMPARPYLGRAAIAALYAAQPPRGLMTVDEIVPLDDRTVRVRFTVASGRASTMVVSWRGELVCAVELTL